MSKDGKKGSRNEKFDSRVFDDKDTRDRGSSKGSRDKSSRNRTANRRPIYTGHNDDSWYCKDPALLDTTCAVPFSYALGSNVRSMYQNIENTEGTWTPLTYQSSIPGIFTIDYIPRWTKSTDGESALSLAMRNNYAFVRSKNSGAKNYDPGAMFMYTGAVDSLYSFYAMCARVASLLDTYNISNAYAPRDIIQALGFDFDDLIANRNRFLSWLQNLPARIGIYVVPANMDIIKRHWYLCSELYTDSNTRKGSIYAFCPTGFYKYNETGTPGTSYLEYKIFRTYDSNGAVVPKTVEQVIAYGSDLLQAMWLVSDAMTMSGDIQKAWPESEWISIPQLSLDYKADIKYDESILLQIEHATGWGIPTGGYNITMATGINEGWLIDDLTYAADHEPTAWGLGLKKLFLNGYSNSIGPKEVMYMTRLMSFPVWDAENEEYHLESYGSEVIQDFHVYYYTYAANGTNEGLSHMLFRTCFGFDLTGSSPTVSLTDFESTMARLAVIQQFDRHPILYPGNRLSNGTIHWLGVAANLDNFSFMERGTLDNINYVATRTMLDVNGPIVK